MTTKDEHPTDRGTRVGSGARPPITELVLPTTVMGSHPQPPWLVDHDRLRGVGVPRVRAAGIWRVDPDHLDEAIEAATLVAIADQEAAGVDVITDGEVGRESYFNHFANSLAGVDRDRIGTGINRRGGKAEVPLVSGPIKRSAPVELDAARFLRRHTDRYTKVTVPGPFTLSQLAQDDHYHDQRRLAEAYARAVNEELHDLAAAGIDMLQIDEPYLQANPVAAETFALDTLALAVDGLRATTTLHTCYGYAAYVTEKTGGYPFFDQLADAPVDYVAIETAQPGLPVETIARLSSRKVVVGVLDLSTDAIEVPHAIVDRVLQLTEFFDLADLSMSPDCGMKYLARPVANAKLLAMVEAARILRHRAGF